MSRPMPRSARPRSIPAGDSDLEPVALLRLISACERELRRTVADRIRRWGFTDVEVLVLWLCHESAEPGLAQSELVANIGVSAAQTSGLVERLRRQGVLVAKRNDSDRRKQYWSLTGDGNRILNEIRADLSFVSAGLTKYLSVDEQKLLTSLLHRLKQTTGQPLALRAVSPDTNDLGQHRDVHDGNTENDN